MELAEYYRGLCAVLLFAYIKIKNRKSAISRFSSKNGNSPFQIYRLRGRKTQILQKCVHKLVMVFVRHWSSDRQNISKGKFSTFFSRIKLIFHCIYGLDLCHQSLSRQLSTFHVHKRRRISWWFLSLHWKLGGKI